MRFQKVLSGLNATPSQIKRNLKNVRPAGYNMNLTELVNYASYNLRPIIELLMKYPQGSELFIDATDCDIIEQTTRIVEIIGMTLETVGFQTNIKHLSFSMQKYWKKVYPDGRVLVDATLLLAILELNSLLENIRAELDAFHRSTGGHAPAQTESGLTSVTNTESTFNYYPNKRAFKSNLSPETKSSLALLPHEFVLRPSIENIPSTTSESQMLGGVTGEDSIPPRKAISNMSFDVEKISGVTDVDEARNILFKCIHDLKAVSEYLGIPRKDAFTQHKHAMHGVQDNQEDAIPKLIDPKMSILKKPLASGTHQSVKEQPPSSSLQSLPQEPTPTDTETIKKEGMPQQSSKLQNENLQLCYCPKCCSAEGRDPGDLRECKNDHVIICIKGCNDDEDDVQIVIRQCPECNTSSEARQHQQMQKSPAPPQENIIPQYFSPQESQRAFQELEEPRGSKEKPPIVPEVFVGAPVEELKDAQKDEPVIANTYGEEIDGIESIVLYNKDSKENNVMSRDEEDAPENNLKKPAPSIESEQVWNLTDDSRIKYFETRKLYLKTKTGEELVISLTVTPKDLTGGGGASSISISNIFNGNDDLKDPEATSKANSIKPQDKIFSYYIPDNYIPLERTKICSSLEFDVSTQNSKIQDRDIKNRNNKIIVQLQQFGTDNLLRACRPAKCCRNSVLNEKIKKRLPYAPSIRSLPLDDDDISVINQSLQMKLQKVKNSTNLLKEFHKNQKDLVNPVNKVLYFFVKGRFLQKKLKETCKMLLTKRKLNYYINLVNDVGPNNNRNWKDFCFSIEESEIPTSHQQPEVQLMKPIFSPTRKIRKKYANFDEKEMGTMQKLPLKEEAFFTRNVRSTIEMRKKLSEGNNVNPTKRPKIACSSKISTFQGYRKPLRVNKYEHVHGKQRKEVKLQKLILRKRNSSDDSATSDVNSGVFSVSESHKDPVNLKPSIAAQSLETCLSRSEGLGLWVGKNSSGSSALNVIKRTRRNKREVYLSRSQSENSLSPSALWGKNNKIAPGSVPKSIRKVVTKTATNTQRVESKKLLILNEERACKLLPEPDAAEILLGCFPKVFYETIITEMKLENLGNNHTKNTNESGRISVTIEPRNNSMQEFYMRKTCYRDKSGIKLSYALNAKPSQFHMLASNIHMVDTLALQNSGILGDSKIGQISSTFKKICDLEDQDQSSSSAKIDDFTVEFKSNGSIKSSVFESDRAFLKFKESLKKYERVKNGVAGRSRKDPPIRPVEYFVYHQVSTCSDKSEKKLSIMQKILRKTKGLFNSSDKDKYKNQKATNSLAKADRKFCRNCGCSIAKCAAMISAPQQLVGSCSEEIQPNIEANKASCKKQSSKPSTSTFGNLSKLASSSVLSIKARFKRSNSSFVKESNRQIGERNWFDKDIMREASDKKANVVPEFYIEDNIMVIKWDRKGKEIGTIKGSSTQNYACGKCENFAENGTCCSLWLDKSFPAKPENQNVESTTDERSADAQIIKSELDKSDVAKIFQSSSMQPEKNSTNILPEDTNSIKENIESKDTRKAEKQNSNN